MAKNGKRESVYKMSHSFIYSKGDLELKKTEKQDCTKKNVQNMNTNDNTTQVHFNKIYINLEFNL